MPDINFLPKENRPKHPPAPNREKIAVEFYRPAAEKNNLKQPVPRSNRPSKISSIFKSLFNKKERNDNLAPRDLSATFGRAGFDLKSSRESLLKQIKSGPAAPVKAEPEINTHTFLRSNKPHRKINLMPFVHIPKFLAWERTPAAEPPGIQEGVGIKFKEIKNEAKSEIKEVKEVKAEPAKKELNLNLAAGIAPIKSTPLKNKTAWYNFILTPPQNPPLGVNGHHKNPFLRGLPLHQNWCWGLIFCRKVWGFILNWFKPKFKAKKLKPEIEVVKPKQASVQFGLEPKRAPEPPVLPPAPIAPPAPITHAPEVKENTNRESSLETNLIKGNSFIFFNWRRASRINIIAIAFCLIIIGGCWGYLFWLEKQRTVSLEIDKNLLAKEERQKKLTEEIDKLSGLRAKTAEVKKLLAKHIYWTNLFNWLEKNTLAGVYYKGFDGDTAGEYVLPALARDFKTFGAQMRVWQEEKIFTVSAKTTKAEVKTQAATQRSNAEETAVEEQNISFDVNLAVKPEIFNQ